MSKTIVSITPVALDRDSRALKIAHSFARWGYESIVVEGQKSTVDFSKYGMKVISLTCKEKKQQMSRNPISHQSFLKRIFKWIWEYLKRKNFSSFLNYVSFYIFKKTFYDQYVKGINKIIPNADVYYLHSYEYFFATKKKIKKNNAKLIYDAHDFYTKINPNKPFLGSKSIKNFQKIIERSLVENADLMFTVSEGVKNLYINEYKSNPIVIRNMHSSDMDLIGKTTIKTYYGLKQSDIVTIIIGNRKEGQALDQIIKVFLRCASNNNYLVFIGGGYSMVKDTLLPKNRKRILFLSRLKPTDIVSIASEANFAILPYFALTNNYKFALPNGFFQMIAAQLPIIFSKDLVEINALNDKECFGMGTDFHDLDQFKKDLRYFLENFSKRDSLNAKGHLTWENEENILKENIQKLIERR